MSRNVKLEERDSFDDEIVFNEEPSDGDGSSHEVGD